MYNEKISLIDNLNAIGIPQKATYNKRELARIFPYTTQSLEAIKKGKSTNRYDMRFVNGRCAMTHLAVLHSWNLMVNNTKS
jgi:hypothetical protein